MLSRKVDEMATIFKYHTSGYSYNIAVSYLDPLVSGEVYLWLFQTSG